MDETENNMSAPIKKNKLSLEELSLELGLLKPKYLYVNEVVGAWMIYVATV